MRIIRLIVSTFLIIMMVAWVSSAAMTVLPDSTASKISNLGYKAHCSFTPYSTIISIVAAAVTYLVARKFGYLKF